MKPKLLLLCGLLSLVFMSGGCHTSPKAKTFLALADTARTVDAAMRVYATAAVAGKISAADQLKVDALHDRYRTAMQSAIRVARHDWTQPAPQSVLILATELLNTLQTLRL
ncbi:MAG: hypothetical protein FD161_2995 [Limisphaerales bacterium]|nr:MAG: hypothetical protein FD161_2995 [Limisphaerales bacterium]KAG0508108.1 MAG: hypothetical protein E1N63_2702 [Limisphaerales bacterium]TXT53039.1 MAG: hypothetical protein FD140_147 [Limisphaerales bacterium]